MTTAQTFDVQDVVDKALEICFNKTVADNNGPQTYAFLASSFAANGKHLYEDELKTINIILREPVNINLYGHYVATVYTSNKGIMLAFQPVVDIEDIIEMRM